VDRGRIEAFLTPTREAHKIWGRKTQTGNLQPRRGMTGQYVAEIYEIVGWVALNGNLFCSLFLLIHRQRTCSVGCHVAGSKHTKGAIPSHCTWLRAEIPHPKALGQVSINLKLGHPINGTPITGSINMTLWTQSSYQKLQEARIIFCETLLHVLDC